jgi:hypothetical protein
MVPASAVSGLEKAAMRNKVPIPPRPGAQVIPSVGMHNIHKHLQERTRLAAAEYMALLQQEQQMRQVLQRAGLGDLQPIHLNQPGRLLGPKRPGASYVVYQGPGLVPRLRSGSRKYKVARNNQQQVPAQQQPNQHPNQDVKAPAASS